MFNCGKVTAQTDYHTESRLTRDGIWAPHMPNNQLYDGSSVRTKAGPYDVEVYNLAQWTFIELETPKFEKVYGDVFYLDGDGNWQPISSPDVEIETKAIKTGSSSLVQFKASKQGSLKSIGLEELRLI